MIRRFSVVLTAALCSGLAHVTLAQTAPEPAEKPQALVAEKKRMAAIRIKNVPPNWMAYWLDPQNNPAPPEFGGSLSTQNPQPLNAKASDTQKNPFLLPAGVDRIIGVAPQKTLFVYGTDAGIKEIEELVKFLDKPLRQVEIEAQFVRVNPESMGDLGIQATPGTTPESFRIGFVRGNFQTTLWKLMAEDKAKIITASRVTTINNLQTDINALKHAPTVATAKEISQSSTQLPQGAGYKNLFLPFTEPNSIQVAQPLKSKGGFHLLVTPTINNDDTLTMLMSLDLKPEISEQNDKLGLESVKKGFETIANVRDGDTVALTGFQSELITNLKTNSTTPDMIIFVTARIVRRAGNDVQTVAPKG